MSMQRRRSRSGVLLSNREAILSKAATPFPVIKMAQIADRRGYHM